MLQGYELKISDEGDAVQLYMKATPDSSDKALAEYQKASPRALLPVSTPTIVAYGSADTDVPPALCASYAQAAIESAPDITREVACLCTPSRPL